MESQESSTNTVPKSLLKVPKSKNVKLIMELRNFFHSTDINLQQAHLKSLLKLANCEEDKAFLSNILSYVVLKLSSKQPLKKSLNRTLLSLPKILVTTCLVSHTCSMIDECINHNSEDYVNIAIANDIIVQLNVCLNNNFPSGIEAVIIAIDPLFILPTYVFLKTCFFLTEHEERQMYLYNSSKFLVSLLNNFPVKTSYITTYSGKIMQAGFKIISDETLDFNTRSNCGILLCLIASTHKNNLNLTELLESCSTFTAQICIFSGIVKIHPLESICDFILEGTEKVVGFFLSLVENATKVTGNPGEIMEVSKAFTVLSKLFINMKQDQVDIVFEPALSYILTHLDHFMDVVKSDTLDAFKNFVKIAVIHEKAGNPKFIKLIIVSFYNMIMGDCINFKTLSIVAGETSCEYLMEQIPNLPLILLDCLRTSSVPQQVCSTYEYLMEMYAEEQPEKWVQVWVKNLIKVITNESSQILQPYQKIFTCAAKLNYDLLLDFQGNLTNCNILLVFSSAIIKIRKLTPNFDATWWGTYFWEDIFQILMFNQFDEIRVLVPQLLVDCKKSTEIYPEQHLKYLQQFLHYNITIQSSSFRQQMIAMYKKGFLRYKDSLYVIRRNINGIKKTLSESNNKNMETQLQVALSQEKYYNSFMHEMINSQLKIGLLSEVNHFRRSACLELLIFLKECLGEAEFNSYFENKYAKLLYDALIDSYESNINMAVKIILDLPPTIAFFQLYEELLNQIKKSIIMAKSIKPNNTTSAAYLLRILKNAPDASKAFHEILQDKNVTTTDSTLLLLNILIKEIRDGIEIARNNIHQASKSAPVYGLLFCIRHLIEKEHFELNNPDVIPEIIDTCLELSTIVSPIVNSSSPEGYLPQNNGVVVDETVTSQMILVYAWRTSKEISLLLGEVNLVSKEGSEIIPLGHLEKIAEYFMVLFMETKHRGAYEQGYVGFSKFCSKLWESEKSTWVLLWLDTILQVLSGKDVSFQKICSTRRSAGIPFVIQAILTTENSSRSHRSFHMCMEKLLEIAQDTETQDNIKAATHSMNILRALFKHNQLGELVVTYISSGVKIAITGFNHSIWGIRNAATLLFAALMTRMFGVQRTKDTEAVSIKNRLAAKVFFMRYPELNDFILKQFRELKSINDDRLYPLLLILSRLYSCNESSIYKEYCPHLTICLGSDIYKIRELAAQSFLSIIPKDIYEIVISTTFNSLSKQDPINLIHGKLLMTKAVLKTCSSKNFNFDISSLAKTFWILRQNNLKFSHVISSVYIEVILIFLFKIKCNNLTKEVGMDLIKSLGPFNGNILKQFPGSTEFEIAKVTIYIDLIANRISTPIRFKSYCIKEILFTVLTCNNEELNFFAANCLKYIFMGTWRSSFMYEEDETDELEYGLVNSFSKSLIINFTSKLTRDKRYINLLRRVLLNMNAKNKNFILKLCLLLPYFGEAYNNIQIKPYDVTKQENLDFLINLCCTSDTNVLVALLPVIAIFVKTYQQNLNYNSLVSKLLVYFSDSEREEEERLNVAHFLLENYNFLYDENILKLESIVEVWYMVLNLLQDDCKEVRDCMSKITTSISLSREKSPQVFYITAEKAFEELLNVLPELVNQQVALNIYLTLSLQHTIERVDVDTLEVFDKGTPNSYKENLPTSAQAKKFLRKSLWTLNHDLSYKDKSIFLEEHTLMVAIKLYNLFSVYLSVHKNSRDVLIALAVLREVINYLEVQPIGRISFKSDLSKFISDKIISACSQTSKFVLTLTTLEYVFDVD